MTTEDSSARKLVIDLTHATPGQSGARTTSQGRPQSSSLPRNSVSVISSNYAANEDTAHQRWMQEYHRSRQARQSPDYKTTSLLSNGHKTVVSPRPLDQSATVNNVIFKFDSLKINPAHSKSQQQQQQQQPQQQQQQQQQQPNLQRRRAETSDMSLKGDRADVLEGYKVYRGQTSITLGQAKRQAERRAPSPDSKSHLARDWDSLDLVVSHDHGRRGSLPFHYYPEKIIISKQIGKDAQSPRQNSTTHFHMARGHSFPFRNHLPPRTRPHSATVSRSSHRMGEKTKGSKPKQTMRKEKASQYVPTKASPLKQGQTYKTVDAISVRQGDNFPLNPRHIATIPRPSFKLDVNAGPKSETQTCSIPKSILKNNSSSDANSFLTIHPFKPGNELTRQMSGNAVSYIMPSDFSLNDFILSPRSVKRTPPAMSGSSSPTTSHVLPASNRIASSPKRPMSAIASPSKYELNGSQSPRRKSVTFNSYVSLMTGDQVSTIRSLSVDV